MTYKTTRILLYLILVFGSVHAQVAEATLYSRPVHNARIHEVKSENIALRTRFSKTFDNTNTTKTTVHSSIPMHYRADDGSWQPLEYGFIQKSGGIYYPRQESYLKFDTNHYTLTAGAPIQFKQQTRFIFVGQNGSVLRQQEAASVQPTTSSSELLYQEVLSGVDKRFTVYPEVLKSDFIIKNSGALPANFDHLVIEEQLILPTGYTLNVENNRILISDERGRLVASINQPIISDSKPVDPKFRHLNKPVQGNFSVTDLGNSGYLIRIRVDGAYLLDSARVYPVIVDPVITLNNNSVVNSCFLPAYEQATLTVAVPAGETVLASEISYDFVAVAGSGAWMADQRSFVSGPNGQTPVFEGQGADEGIYTYTIANSPIANVVSNGQITYTFNIGRNWGGSGCNATYNFVNRREVTVTYGTLEFGDGPLMINEFSASNQNFPDGFGRTEDWIELYNASPDTYFNLAGYYLSNDIDEPTKWQIENGVIPPNSRVLVFCSDRDIASGTVLHADFDLTQLRPDQVVLADPSGTILEAHQMYVTQTNHSYGRTTDGATSWGVFTNPTPGTSNAGSFSAYATRPQFNMVPGRYSGTITVALSSTGSNEQIRYTTNGSTPNASSPLYTSPITVSQSSVIRARSFSTNPQILPSFIETNTYFINENSTLPVFSFAGDADLLQLFNGNAGLEPIGSFEFFESDGTFIEESVGDFNKHGNDSWAYPQRGVDFVTRDDHGYNRRWDYKFFATTDRTQFRWLMVKPAASDNYPHQAGGAHLRDAFVQTLSQLSDLELDERSCTFVNLFVNGQYWGVYDLRERVDDNNYTDHYYNQDYTFRDSDIYLQYLKTWGSTENRFGNQAAADDWNELVNFILTNDMSLQANYNFVDSQLNIDSLIDYFVINSYMVNRDWLNFNTSWWRGLNPAGEARKWRYTLWDMDGVLGHYANFTGIPDTTENAPPCQVESIDVGVGHSQSIGKLIQENPIVRQRYITRYADLLNTKLKCERVTQVFDSIVNLLTPEMPRQIQRWGGDIATWQENVQAARNFLLARCSQTISTGMVDCYDVTGPFETIFQVSPAGAGKIRMNSEFFNSYPSTAQIFGNIDTNLKAEPNDGFVFSHWVVDGAVIQPDPENPEILLQISQATSVTAFFEEVIDNGGDVMHYWHFNTLNTPTDVTSILPDFTVIPQDDPLLTYTGSGPRDIDANDTGSLINLHMGELPGKSARVRNPSDGRTVEFLVPTTGYKDIKFAYAVQRTNNGQLANNLAYSLDGINFTQNGMTVTTFPVSTEFSLVSLNFTGIPGVNNNAKFKVRVTFQGNTSGESGNNRFDNVTVKGTPINLSVTENSTAYQVFPNPFTDNVTIISANLMERLEVVDLMGKKVWQMESVAAEEASIDLSGLSDGIYMLRIHSDMGVITHKLVKE